MVSTAIAAPEIQEQLVFGLSQDDASRIDDVLAYVEPFYAGRILPTGQDALEFSKRLASVLAVLNTDADTRIAGLLFELPVLNPQAALQIESRFGKDIADLVSNIRQLMRLHELTFNQPETAR